MPSHPGQTFFLEIYKHKKQMTISMCVDQTISFFVVIHKILSFSLLAGQPVAQSVRAAIYVLLLLAILISSSMEITRAYTLYVGTCSNSKMYDFMVAGHALTCVWPRAKNSGNKFTCQSERSRGQCNSCCPSSDLWKEPLNRNKSSHSELYIWWHYVRKRVEWLLKYFLE